MSKIIQTINFPIVFCFALLLSILQISTPCYSFEIEIDVAPATLNLESGGSVVTVHTNIDFDVVAASTVTLNNTTIKSWKVDNRGNFVAKFSMDEVKSLDGLVIGDYNTLTLFGYTKDGETFIGVANIMVIDVFSNGN